jgi:hypothetical protein
MGGRKARQGNFSRAYKGPREVGLFDWAKSRQAYADQMARQVEEGKTDSETNLWRENGLHLMSPEDRDKFLEVRAMRRGGAFKPHVNLTAEDRSRGGRSSHARKADVPEIVRLYTEENQKPQTIADSMGLRVETVREWLKKRGVWDKSKHMNKDKPEGSGKKASHVCSKGHYKEPGQACLTCHADYQREYQRTRRRRR